jgi:hypothetical protein
MTYINPDIIVEVEKSLESLRDDLLKQFEFSPLSSRRDLSAKLMALNVAILTVRSYFKRDA